MIAYGTKIKEKAIVLRKKGKSFSQIAKTLNIGKSTVGFWFKNIIKNSKPKISAQKKSVKAKAKLKGKKK
jgi:transposase-like protein